ncbi:MAG: arginine--tRNA ligase [Gemmataceae bacterium]
MNLLTHLRTLFAPAVSAAAADPAKVPDYLAAVKPAGNPDHGDYQANFAMAMAKAAKKVPWDLAREIVAALPASADIEPPTTAHPGFINVKFTSAFLARAVRGLATDERLGLPLAAKPRTYVIDLSGPNVAKPLHVGHLRSTIIGDALVRILRALGHTVVGDNHLGDWGTQFGILLYGYKHHRDDTAFAADPVRELARLYVAVRKLFKQAGDDDEEGPTDDPVKKACQEETAKLHAGDPENVALWKTFMPACLEMLRPIYDRLDVHIDHALGESYYNPMLPGVVADLLAKGLAKESQGAVVIPNAKGVIPTGEETKKEDPPALVRKKDGAFTYTTTDLATIRYRVETWKPDVLLYVVDFRQSLHFKTLFAAARRWGIDSVEMQHLSFGSVLGEDKKPFAARTGGAPELSTLLDEAVKIGRAKYLESYESRKGSGHKVPDLTPAEQEEIAEAVGIGAVKYADLSQNRTSDYVFSYDKMLATEGNTATYLQYAYARCRSIFREENIDPARFRTDPPAVVLGEPAERALALQLLRFPEAVEAAAADYLPHMISGYLWDLAKAASVFYEKCHVLKAPTPELRDSRLLLVDLVGRTIRRALELLGIRVVERM